jgi:hypothetical protein
VPGGPPDRDGADAAAILDAWLARVGNAAPDALLLPTPLRGRTPSNLTVRALEDGPGRLDLGAFDDLVLPREV